MSDAPVIIVDTNESRRRTLSLLIRASTRLDVGSFPAISAAFPGFYAPSTRVLPDQTQLFLCPWDEGGESIITERIVLGRNRAALLVLSDTISPARIALCQKAGNTHLIPSDPLNLNALRTRILFSLEGPTTLAERVSRSGAALRETLVGFPALKRRLAIT